MFCSQYTARCFRIAGLRFVAGPDNTCSPEDIEKSSHLTYSASIRRLRRRLRRLDDVPSE